MKTHLIILLSLFSWHSSKGANVTQEIRYSCTGASEVFLVWGVNNWQLLPESEIPAGSFVKDKLIYTEMRKTGESFTAQLPVAEGTVIDYVFWITGGPFGKGTDVWDLNAPKKDFHTLAHEGTVAFVQSKLTIRPAEEISIVDFAFVLLLCAVTGLILLLFIRRAKINTTGSARPYLVVAASSVILTIYLLLIRPSVLGNSWEIITAPGGNIDDLFVGGIYDVWYVLIFSLLFCILIFFTRKISILQKALTSVFILCALLSLFMAILNVRVVQLLGKPFNYQWLYYSDFLKSPDSQAAIMANTSPNEMLRIGALLLSAFVFGWMVLNFLAFLYERKFLTLKRLAIVPAFIALYLCIGHFLLQEYNWKYDKLANPVTAFLQSVNPLRERPALFTMEVNDSLIYRKPGPPKTVAPKAAKLSNVLLFVLESVPAEYVDPYGSSYSVTPVLRRYAGQSLLFRNVYAHAPATNLSMVSMLNSIYPWLSYNSLTEEHPDLEVPSLSSELKEQGYRTGFFNSADNRYQKAGLFLKNRKFDEIRDCNENSCGNQVFEVHDKSWEYMNGKEDGCTAQELNQWISSDTSRPFFSVMWTYQTHYPYFNKGSVRSFANDSTMNRYLNALHYGDSILGVVLNNLEKSGLLESTLVVVVGDHGEAFGRHDQITHGRKIYEENLHVPCMFINPAFEYQEYAGNGGLVDLAPTILHLLGKPQPGEWEGESLFEKTKNSRVYFFAPWSDHLFGYREGDRKYIYNATSDENEVYDLSTDPLETTNLALQQQENIPYHQQRLASWAQHVTAAMDKHLKKVQTSAILANSN